MYTLQVESTIPNAVDSTASAVVKNSQEEKTNDNKSLEVKKSSKEEKTDDSQALAVKESSPKNFQVKNLKNALDAIKKDNDYIRLGIVNLCKPESSHQAKIAGLDDIALLVEWLKSSTVRTLNLSGNYLSEIEPVLKNYITDIPIYSGLSAIGARGTHSNHNANLLADGLRYNADLIELDMHATSLLPVESLEILKTLQTCKRLRHIDWSHNRLDPDCCREIVKLIFRKPSSIKTVKIAYCQLSPKCITQFLDDLKQNTKENKSSLRCLDLSSSGGLNESQARTVLYILQQNSSLVSVSMDFEVGVTVETKQAIKAQIESNKSNEEEKLQALMAPKELFKQALKAVQEDDEDWLKILLGKSYFEDRIRNVIQMKLGRYAYQNALIKFEIKFLEKKIKILKSKNDNADFDYLEWSKKKFQECLNSTLESQAYLFEGKAVLYFGDDFINPQTLCKKRKY